jgi:hypothetical protein
MRLTTYIIILMTFQLAFGGGFTGSITTDMGDVVAGAHIIAKQGDIIISDTLSNSLGEYSIEWNTTGTDNFDFNLPSTEFLGLGNSISGDGHVYAFLNGGVETIGHRIFDIQGRDVTRSNNFAQGKYFLQVYDKFTGKNLGVSPFVLMGGHLSVELRSTNPKSGFLSKSTLEDTDSLIVVYEADDMELIPYREAVVVPADGFNELNFEMVRNRQRPVITFSNIPENPTIDTSYVIIINAVSPDYDSNITDLDVFHIAGDSIQYEFNGVDSLVISAHTQGYHEFHVLANNEYSHSGRNIELTVESLTHTVQTLDFFGNLDGPYLGLGVWLRDKFAVTDENGVAVLEVPATGGELSITDSIEIYHPTNDTTFYAMRLPVTVEADTQKVTTLTDPKGPSYWAVWNWDHLLHRESWLNGIPNHPNFQFKKFGNLETGISDTIFFYCPNYSSPNGLQYRPIIDSLLHVRNQDLDDRAGEGRISKVHFHLLENTLEDSIFADEQGILLHFDGTISFTQYDTEMIAESDLLFITNVDAHIYDHAANNEAGIEGTIRLFHHEALGHGLGLNAHTPYNWDYPENQENMISGAVGTLKDHELDGIFFRLNYTPAHIRQFIGYETFHLDN